MSYVEQIDPDSIIVAFDRKDKTFRQKCTAIIKELDRCLMIWRFGPFAKEVDALNVSELKGYEADDLTGTYAKIAPEDDYDVYIVTGDKDAFS